MAGFWQVATLWFRTTVNGRDSAGLSDHSGAGYGDLTLSRTSYCGRLSSDNSSMGSAECRIEMIRGAIECGTPQMMSTYGCWTGLVSETYNVQSKCERSLICLARLWQPVPSPSSTAVAADCSENLESTWDARALRKPGARRLYRSCVLGIWALMATQTGFAQDSNSEEQSRDFGERMLH